MSLPISEIKSTSSTGALVESFLSTPEIVSRTIALSLTFLVIGPIWSNEDAKATKPKRDTSVSWFHTNYTTISCWLSN